MARGTRGRADVSLRLMGRRDLRTLQGSGKRIQSVSKEGRCQETRERYEHDFTCWTCDSFGVTRHLFRTKTSELSLGEELFFPFESTPPLPEKWTAGRMWSFAVGQRYLDLSP